MDIIYIGLMKILASTMRHVHPLAIFCICLAYLVIYSMSFFPFFPVHMNQESSALENISAPSNVTTPSVAKNLFENSSFHYLYGCTLYEYEGFHCDPISNDFVSYAVLADFSNVSSVTRSPDYVAAKHGEGIHMRGTHGIESLRANIIPEYKADQFSVYVSISPEKYEEIIGNSYMTIVAFKHGVYRNDPNKAGWVMEFVPSNSSITRSVRFTVFNTNGTGISSKDAVIPNEKFSELTGTFDGKKVGFYVNGVLVSQTPFTGKYSGKVDEGVIVKRNNFLTVAGDAYCTCYLFTGILDEIRYYNYALDSNLVKRINSLNDVLGNGLIGYWKFDGNLKDRSPLGNDMFYNTLVASMEFAPDGRMFYTEKNSGLIRIMMNDSVLPLPFASIPDVHVDFEQGLLGLAIDSKFSQNHFVYVYYNYKDASGNVYARIVRFTDSNNRGINPVVILDKIPASGEGIHTGGALMFNPLDDKLYVTVGDAIENQRAQNLSSLNGKTLRINRDGTIPEDNPFPNSPIFTYGHRNMFGIAFDERGHGIVAEPGPALYDEINSQIKGGNYGWPDLQPPDIAPDPAANDSSIKPLRSYYITSNPTQAVYYNGDKHPELKGMFIVGSFRGNLYAYKISEDGKSLLKEIRFTVDRYPSLEVVATAVSPAGDIYFGAYDIFKLGKIDMTSRVNTMLGVGINSTNVKVSDLNYTEPSKELGLKLKDQHNSGSLSLKIPKELVEDLPPYYEISSSRNSTESSQKNNHPTVVEKNRDFSILKINIPNDAPEQLQILINKSKISLYY